MPDPIYDVFLSYASRDRAAVVALARRLKAEGLNPFLDDWDLIPGEARQEGLEAALEQSRTLAAFVSAGEIGPWQNEEIRDALDTRTKEKGYRVIPVLLPGATQPEDDALPRFLRRLTWVKFRQDLEDAGTFHRLVSGIKGLAPGPDGRPPTEAETLAEELDAAYETLHEQEEQELDTREIRARILDLRRKLRDGGLKAGYRLAEGRYKLIRRVGKGGFAEVWKAYDRTRREHVAIKILHQQFCEDRTRRERFARGAKQMANLSHQNIVSVLEEVREDAGRYYFVMEFLDGGDFQRAVCERRIDLKQRQGTILKAGEALQFAHDRGIIHRDVKPANILLSADGTPKLTDFDLVRADHQTTGGTRTGMLGTVVYSPPEMLDRPQDADARADVFGLGMTAVFAQHGKELPFEAFLNAHGFLGDSEAEEGLSKILTRAVAHRVEDRWSSVQEFCAALESGSSERQPIRATPVALGPSPRSLDEARRIIESGQRRIDSSGRFRGVDDQEIVLKLVGAMQYPELPAPERHKAGLLASDLGHLPEDLDAFVTLPEEWFGYLFQIARYPVTNAQYRRFMEDGGYDRDKGWLSEEARKEMAKNKRASAAQPRFWDDPNRNHTTQPVGGTSWYEAEAYCQWLTAKLRVAGEIGNDQKVSLPTFEERMKAAEGTADRRFPWGDGEDVYRLNCEESGISSASPVDMYPDGATPEGVWDLSGNVWEWTNTEEKGSRSAYFLGGKSWYGNISLGPFAAGGWADAHSSWIDIGFRVSISPLLP